MCSVEAAALALSAAGTVASVSASERAAREQRRAVNRGLEEEAGVQRRANDRTEEYVQDTFDPTKRAANYEAEAAKTEKSFGDLLAQQAAAGQGAINPAAAGALSDTYTRARAQSTADAATKTRSLSKMLARGGAMSNLLGSEALTGADYASDMLGYGVDSRLAQRRADVRYGQAGSAGNGLALAGGLLSGSAGVLSNYRPRQNGIDMLLASNRGSGD